MSQEWHEVLEALRINRRLPLKHGTKPEKKQDEEGKHHGEAHP